MKSVPKILVRARAPALVGVCLVGLSLLSACGQKGDLVLPNDPDFQQRATLPDIIRRQFPEMPPAKPAGSAAPAAANPSSTPAAPAPASR